MPIEGGDEPVRLVRLRLAHDAEDTSPTAVLEPLALRMILQPGGEMLLTRTS